MSTLQTLKMLGKHELELFEKMCSLCISSEQIPQEIFSLPDNLKPLMNSLEVDFGSLQELQNLGLFLPIGKLVLRPVSKYPNVII